MPADATHPRHPAVLHPPSRIWASSQFRKRLPSTSVQGSSGESRLRRIVMDDEPTTGSVQLIVDYSDGCKKCFNLPWKSSMSVADVLAAAKSTSIGLEFVVNEKNGEIQSIDGVFPPKEPHFVGL